MIIAKLQVNSFVYRNNWALLKTVIPAQAGSYSELKYVDSRLWGSDEKGIFRSALVG